MPTRTSTKPAKRRATRKTSKTPANPKKKFGRAGTAGKGEGDAAVRAWMESVKPNHRPIVERLDALIGEVVPDVKRAVKWSMPMYGRPGRGFFAHLGSFKNHVRLGFFAGARLDPPPPEGEGKGMRSVNIQDPSDVDEEQFRSWIKQASSIQGWGTV